MRTYAVLATGPSMNQELADYVRGKCHAVAVCDAFRLAPWADALVCQDRNWWDQYPEALQFSGRKFSGAPVQQVETLRPDQEFESGCNSGLQGMRVARLLGATRILLLGFDMRGTHYFGSHPEPLRNTTDERFGVFIRQFDRWRGWPPVINCTPGSALKQFAFGDIRELLRAEKPTAH